MAFTPKKIVAKVTGGDPGGFNPMNSQFEMNSFKLTGKKFKSVPKGFLAIQPEENMIYAGFDYNPDGVINVINESFAQFFVQLNYLTQYQLRKNSLISIPTKPKVSLCSPFTISRL